MVEQARELVRKSGKAMVIEGAREGTEIPAGGGIIGKKRKRMRVIGE